MKTNPYVDESKDDLVEWQQEMDADDELNTDGLCIWFRFKPRRSARAERLQLPSMALTVNRIGAY